MTVIMTPAQQVALRRALAAPGRVRSERVWTYLIASILDSSPNKARYLQMLCQGEPILLRDTQRVQLEAQPLSPRKGTGTRTETNSRIDLALGDLAQRGATASGIDPAAAERSWVCFVEAKMLADCSVDVTHDPLRNQLTRVIESLLAFEAGGVKPAARYFTLLTPRRFHRDRRSRLYGFKFDEYVLDRRRLAADIDLCAIPERYEVAEAEWAERIERLRLSWVTYEDILEPELGMELNLAQLAISRTSTPALEEWIDAQARLLQAPGGDRPDVGREPWTVVPA